MLLKVNVRLLEKGPMRLEGELDPVPFLEGFEDELVRFVSPIHHDLTVERQGTNLLLQGRIWAELECGCSRCLKTFPVRLEIGDFTALVPLEGEEAAQRDGDFADLTPPVRADTFLALPTKPLCTPECRGLPQVATARDSRLGVKPNGASPWGPLDRLKL